MNKYGECSSCRIDLEPIWFVEEERDNRNIPTGRKRQAVSYLNCPNCLKKYVVDDSFDRPWRKS